MFHCKPTFYAKFRVFLKGRGEIWPKVLGDTIRHFLEEAYNGVSARVNIINRVSFAVAIGVEVAFAEWAPAVR